MSADARASAASLRRAIELKATYVPFVLQQRRPNNTDVQELFDRLTRCRLCVRLVAQATRRHARLTAAVPGKPLKTRQRLNRLRDRVGHQSMIALEAFYWNAARAADAAHSLGLLKGKERFALLDAYRVRNLLIEHQEYYEPLQRPSMSMHGDPALKPGSTAKLDARGMYAHARQLADLIKTRVTIALAGTAASS